MKASLVALNSSSVGYVTFLIYIRYNGVVGRTRDFEERGPWFDSRLHPPTKAKKGEYLMFKYLGFVYTSVGSATGAT